MKDWGSRAINLSLALRRMDCTSSCALGQAWWPWAAQNTGVAASATAATTRAAAGLAEDCGRAVARMRTRGHAHVGAATAIV